LAANLGMGTPGPAPGAFSIMEDTMIRTRTVKPDTTNLLTIREGAARMRCSTDYLRDLLRRREIDAAKIGPERGKRGGKWLIPESEIVRWLERNMTAAR